MRSLLALIAAAVALAVTSTARGAADPSSESTAAPSPGASVSPVPADCTLVPPEEIDTILGYEVQSADAAARSGGVCFFASKSVSDDWSASYAVVDNDRLQQRRAYYLVLVRRCAGVAATARNAVVCKSFSALAQAKDLEEYYAARTDFPNSEAVKGLGDAAVAAGEALYVRRGDVVFEVAIKHGDALDVDRSTTLAKLVLARVPAASPEPSSSPRRPKTP